VVREIPIRGETIRLGQLLKLAGIVDSGSEVKALLAAEPVWVNGEPEARRGRQLRLGDAVRVAEHELRVTAAGLPAPENPGRHASPDHPADPPSPT
jgi:ribosome-associated protein